MKKFLRAYFICWALLLVLFNLCCFITPNEALGLSKFRGSFWIGYIFITIAFIGQFICTYIAVKPEKIHKVFYNLPIISLSYIGLIMTTIIGTLCMVIPDLPIWVGIIVCFLVLVFNIAAILKASVSANIVETIDTKNAVKTRFVREATINAQSIISKAKSAQIKAECEKVYDSIRYSDPMSSPELLSVETQIKEKIVELSSAVNENDSEKASCKATEILSLIEERNNKCKMLK